MERIGPTPWKERLQLNDSLTSLSNSKMTGRDKSLDTDRFIPKQLNFNCFQIESQNCRQAAEGVQSPAVDSNLNESLRIKSNIQTYRMLLRGNITEPYARSNKVLSYNRRKPYKGDFLMDTWSENEPEIESVRKINKQPYKILDAPKLKDDFYNNLLDWNKDDLIAISLGNIAYVWSGRSNEAEKLAEGRISCVKWAQKLLAIGDQNGTVRIYDVEKKKMVSRYNNHLSRVGTIDFNHNIMATGSKDQRIMLTDIRTGLPYSKFYGHRQEVCGLKFSFDDAYLASGGNDNAVILWSPKMGKQIVKFDKHCAAVKGLAWSPHKHSLLLSGGGTTDKSIKSWNVQELKLIDSIDTGSQVCNMVFSQNSNELLTTHGYSFNTIGNIVCNSAVWRQKDMKKIATLHGHTYRVLYLAISPDGQNIVTGSGDETLRFWKVFPSRKHSAPFAKSNLDMRTYQIR